MSSQVIEKLKDKPHLFERFFRRLLPFDHLIMIYCWIIIILTVNFARPIGDYLGLLLFHGGTIVMIIVMAKFVRSLENRLVFFIRILYPIILMTFFYQFSGKLVQVVVPWLFDEQLAMLEKAVLGVHPTLWLDPGSIHVIITELLSAAYFSYYFMIPGLALVLFLGKKDRELRRFVTATCVTFFASYLIFIFYPVAGPRFYFAGMYINELTGPIFRPLVNLIIDNAAFKGGAMPSSHVAEAIIVMMFAIRSYGRKAYFLIPIVIGLAMGTIYGRFHFASDVVVGAVLAFIIYWFTLKFYPTQKDFSRKWKLSDFDKKVMYVSDSL